jgi:hypothetical protein
MSGLTAGFRQVASFLSNFSHRAAPAVGSQAPAVRPMNRAAPLQRRTQPTRTTPRRRGEQNSSPMLRRFDQF